MKPEEVSEDLIDLAMHGAKPGCRSDAAFYLANVLPTLAEGGQTAGKSALVALVEVEAQRDMARDAAVALEQENARVRALHSSRLLTEYSDDDRKEETGHTWQICEACTDPDVVDALDDGELIEEGETVHWPCATVRAMDGGEGS